MIQTIVHKLLLPSLASVMQLVPMISMVAAIRATGHLCQAMDQCLSDAIRK